MKLYVNTNWTYFNISWFADAKLEFVFPRIQMSSTDPGSKSSLPVHDTYPDTSQIVVCKNSILIPWSLSVLKPVIHNRKRKRNRNRKRKIGKRIFLRWTKYIRLQEIDDSPLSFSIKQSSELISNHILTSIISYLIISILNPWDQGMSQFMLT